MTVDTERKLRAERLLAEHIAAVVAQAPPFTAAQIDRLAGILAPLQPTTATKRSRPARRRVAG